MSYAERSESAALARSVFIILGHSPLGHRLSRLARFERFRPDTVTVLEWTSFVKGFSDLFHHEQAIERAGDMLFACRGSGVVLTKRQQKEFVCAQAIHDTPEGLTGVDIPSVEKTGSDRSREYRLYDRALGLLFSNRPGLFRQVRHSVRDVLGAQDPLVGDLHFCVTQLGHIEDAYDVAKKLQEIDTDSFLAHQLQEITKEIPRNAIKKLTNCLSHNPMLIPVVEEYSRIRNLPLRRVEE